MLLSTIITILLSLNIISSDTDFQNLSSSQQDAMMEIVIEDNIQI